MSKHDSSLSKAQFDLLNAFKKQITSPHSTAIAKQPEHKVQVEPAPEDDEALFKKSMHGVKKMDTSNIAKIEKDKKKNWTAKRWLSVHPQ